MRWRRVLVTINLLFAFSSASSAVQSPIPNEQIRLPIDGAGPSHLFWLTPNGDQSADYVGVVDPLFSAIRYYAIARGTTPLANRIAWLGACALPPLSSPDEGIRPWRIHHLADAVILESVPRPSGGRRDAHKTTAALMTATIYRVPRMLDVESAAATGKRLADSEDGHGKPWNPSDSRNLKCGTAVGESNPAASAPYVVWGSTVGNASGLLKGHSTVTMKPKALGGDGYSKIEINGSILNVTPIEPANNRRNFIVTTTDKSDDGVLRFYRSIVSVPKNQKGNRDALVARINPTALRSKMGLQPFSVLPDGELLMMGRDPDSVDGYKLWSCGQLSSSAKQAATTLSACNNRTVVSMNDSGSRALSDDGQTSLKNTENRDNVIDKSVSADEIFERTYEARSIAWSFDAAKIPDKCRSSKGCKRGSVDKPYIPPASQRLTFGKYEGRGLPYAQGNPLRADDFLSHSSQFEAAVTSAADIPLHGMITPGNLEDKFEGDGGIDCSALIALAWTNDLTHQADTETIQTAGDLHICPTRVPFENLATGDALNIRLYGANGGKLTNHVVLFAQVIKLDGANSFFQVLESSSSCDGVCWSFYDPSYFSGWGAYRRTGVRENQCPINKKTNSIKTNPFPNKIGDWRKYLGDGQ